MKCTTNRVLRLVTMAISITVEPLPDIGPTEPPIIPIYIRDDNKTFMFTNLLFQEGVFVNPVISLAVRSEASLIRFSLMATHTRKQFDYAVDKMFVIAQKLNVPLLAHLK